MFEFLKKTIKSTSQLTIEEQVGIVEQIHNDFYSAQDLLIKEANRILNINVSFDETKSQRLRQLKSLGFYNIAEVKVLEELQDQQEIQETIAYYSQVYPFCKFIDQDSVEAISKKYNLVLASCSDYIAEIPEKNQNEIINFRVASTDIRYPDEIFYHEIGIWYYQSKLKHPEFLSGQHLLIVAPQHKLDMRGKRVEKGILKIDDPIVLQPVKRGYLIVTAWGLEASDKIIVNQKMN